VEDVRAAAAHLADTVAPPALLVGHSIGGAACLTAAADLDDVAAVATIAAPADLTHLERHLGEDALRIARDQGEATVTLAGREFTISAAFLDDLAAHDLAGRVAELDVATLFLHAPGDRVVGIDQATALFTAARHPKSFVSLDDADHLLSDTSDAWWVADIVSAWASRYVPTER
jgi:pimeloyl-ACP methyl ester carboxylesterase